MVKARSVRWMFGLAMGLAALTTGAGLANLLGEGAVPTIAPSDLAGLRGLSVPAAETDRERAKAKPMKAAIRRYKTEGFTKNAALVDKIDDGLGFDIADTGRPSPYDQCLNADGSRYAGPGTALNPYASTMACLAKVSAGETFVARTVATVGSVTPAPSFDLEVEGGGSDGVSAPVYDIFAQGPLYDYGPGLFGPILGPNPPQETIVTLVIPNGPVPSEVPLPAGAWVFLTGLGALAKMRRGRR